MARTITFIYECTYATRHVHGATCGTMYTVAPWQLAPRRSNEQLHSFMNVHGHLPCTIWYTLGCLINASGHTATHCNSDMNVILFAPCTWLGAPRRSNGQLHSYMNVHGHLPCTIWYTLGCLVNARQPWVAL